MASGSSLHTLELKDYLILGLHKVITETIGKVLLAVLVWGTPRRKRGQPFKEYLFDVKNISGVEYRKGFNKSQRDKMNSDPQIDSYDVSLLYQCIQYGCDGLASPKDPRWVDREDTLERHLTSLKTHRNDFMHMEYEINKQSYPDKIEEIRNLLTDIIQKAAKHYKRSEAEIKQLVKEINDELNQIRDQPFNASASVVIYDKLSILFKTEGRIELQRKYKTLSSMSPISNLLGQQILVRIKKIFTKIEIHRANTQELVAVDKLFEFVDSQSCRKNLLLVEGVAGAGKTTLIRMILQEWSQRSSKIKNLDSYDLAIWTECRDGGTPSLAHLLHTLMPIVTKKIQGDAQVVKCIQRNELLILVDGLDELNASSERVFREILALENTDIITIICTTRPNKVPDIKRYVPHIFEIYHVRINGIAEQDREEFVRNYSQELESQAGATDITGLTHYLKSNQSRFQEHWRLPFNLVLVTILWSLNKDIVNEMTTATELFIKTYELCKERLIQRLHDNEATSRLSSNDMRENLTLFVKVMANIAFASHYNDESVLSETSVHRLKEACELKALPPKEVMSSFLVQAVSLNDKNQEKFSFPHKGIQDFFCALHIEQTLEHEDTNINIPRILSSFEQILLENMVPKVMIPSFLQTCKSGLGKIHAEASSTCHIVRSIFEEALKGVTITEPKQAVHRGQSLTDENSANLALEYDLRKWRNVLVHLTGLLHHRGRSLTEERAEEMVNLLVESGITDSNEWFDFLSNVKCDAAISKHIVLRGRIRVTDARVEAFLKVLDHAEPDRVEIYIEGDPSTTPGLKELLMALREKDWLVDLRMHHDFRFPKEGGSILDGTLCKLFRSNLRLKVFQGQLSASALEELPARVMYLWLSVKDGAHFRSLLPSLTSWAEERKRRRTAFWIHVPVDIDELSLRPLPWEPWLYLRLSVSGVGEATAEKASAVARALLPSGDRYSFLRFPGVGRTTTDCERLIRELGQRGVEVGDGTFGGASGGVHVSPSLDEAEERTVKDLARRELDCKFQTKSEDDIWTSEAIL